MCLTERQSGNKKSDVIKTSREMLQQMAVGLAIHQSIRSKGLVNMLHGFRMLVEYNRLLRVESQIEASVLKRMEQNNELFLQGKAPCFGAQESASRLRSIYCLKRSEDLVEKIISPVIFNTNRSFKR